MAMDDSQYFSPTAASQTWLRTPSYIASPSSPTSPTWPSQAGAASPTSPNFANSSSRLSFDYASRQSGGSTSSPSLNSFGSLSAIVSGASSSAPGSSYVNTSTGAHPYTPVSPTFPSQYPSFVTPHSPLLSPQKESASGPSRVLTRKQRAALQQTAGTSSRSGLTRPSIRSATASSSRISTVQTQTQQLEPQSLSDASSSLRSASPALSATSSLTSISSGASPSHNPSSPYHSSNQFSSPATQFATPLSQSRAKSRKQRLFNIDRKEICKYAAEHPNSRQEDIATRFGVERSTISKILKNKSRWLNVPSDEEMRIAKHRPSKFPEIEEELVRWLVEVQAKNQRPQDLGMPYNAQTRITLTDSLIRSQAKSVAKRIGVPEDKFKASSGWVENFKHRHGIRGGVWRGDGKNTKAARAMGCGYRRDDSLYPTHTTADDERNELSQSPTLQPYEPGPRTPVDLQPSLPSPVDPPLHSPFEQPSTYSTDAPSAFNNHTPAFDSTQSAYPSYEETTYTDNGYPTTQFSQAFAPPPPNPDIPSHADAEASLNRLLAYLDTTGQDIITSEERTYLDRVKRAMFQAASGIPYIRPGSG